MHLTLKKEATKPASFNFLQQQTRFEDFSTVFAGQYVGIREVADEIWLVSFMDYDLGYFDEEEARVEPGPNPFVPDV